MARKAAYKKNKNTIMSISPMILVVVVILLIVGIKSAGLKQKIDQRQEEIARLESQIAEEKARTEEIEEYSKYTQTKGYVEEVAKEKLNLTYEDEIIFKEDD